MEFNEIRVELPDQVTNIYTMSSLQYLNQKHEVVILPKIRRVPFENNE